MSESNFEQLQESNGIHIAVIESSIEELPTKLTTIHSTPSFISVYVSPYLDINQVGELVSRRFPDVPTTMCTTAGELRATDKSIYCETGNYWNRVVLQCFSSSVIDHAEVVAIPLESEDLRRGTIEIDLEERIARLRERLTKLDISMDIDHRDTLAYILFDGMSFSESFFMEALYESGRFPCLFVGGSAGGKNGSHKTWLHNGRVRFENHALVAFLKMAPETRFGIMKSQNFIDAGTSFSIFSASVEHRYVSHVIDNTGNIVSLIDALCSLFQCQPASLHEKMTDYSFAIPVGEELFIRSIRVIDMEQDRVYFYCDISPGENLLLVKKESLTESTARDLKKFMEGKPGTPIGGILNDCILRRQLNKSELPHMGKVMANTAIAGFSTYGEILGLNLNQTLTAIFFFHVPKGQRFNDDYVDNFPIYYGEFKAFFLKRQIAKLRGLSQILVKQIDDFKRHRYTSCLTSVSMDPIMQTVFEDLNDLGQTLSEANEQRRLQTSEIEHRLLESEERFRLLAESSMTGIYHLQQGRFKYVNKAFAQMFGYRTEEILDRLDFVDLIAPADRRMVSEKILRRERESEHSIRYTFRGLRKNSSTFFVEVHGRRINYDGVMGIIGTLIDITEQKKVERHLRESEERYRVFYNETPSMFFTINGQGIITAVNDFAARQLGYSKNELEGNYYSNIFHEADKDAIESKIATSLQTPEQVFQWQFRKIHKNGSLMWNEEFVHVSRDPNGKTNLLVVCQDITERKRLEESLELTRYIFDKASVGIFLTADDGELIDINVQACRSLGYSKEELLKLNITEWNPLFGTEQYTQLIDEQSHHAIKSFETVHRRKTGELFPVQILISSLVYEEYPLNVAFVHDISEQKKAEAEHLQLQDQLQQTQKMEAIGRLAGGIAHDLNNLLTPILGYAELLLLQPGIENRTKERLIQISKAATGAKDLVKQLLAFSRKQVMEYRPLNINQVVSDFENLIRQSVRENIEISINLSADVLPILADRGQIEQVLLNLIVNASDAMLRGGKLVIETRMVELTQSYKTTHDDITPGPYVVLRISDTGTGIDKETIAKIFEPFYSTKGDKGTGLGLATVYGIVKQHNGDILVQSKIGKGTEFKIYLPITTRQLQSDEIHENKKTFDVAGTETILLVEDNKTVRQTINEILSENGYQVLSAASGEEALKLLADNITFDMLITDVVMSGMNGRELFIHISERYPDMKVLYISGYTDDIFIHLGEHDDQIQLLQKPFSSFVILQKVREILDA